MKLKKFLSMCLVGGLVLCAGVPASAQEKTVMVGNLKCHAATTVDGRWGECVSYGPNGLDQAGVKFVSFVSHNGDTYNTYSSEWKYDPCSAHQTHTCRVGNTIVIVSSNHKFNYNGKETNISTSENK